MNFDLLQEPVLLSEDQIRFYQENRFIKIKNVLSKEVIDHFNEVISKRVNELNTEHTPLAQRNTYGKAFLQLMNLWTGDEEIKKLIFSSRIAKLAADLM